MSLKSLSGLGDIVRGDTIRYLELLNERQAEEINYLKKMLEREQSINDSFRAPKVKIEMNEETLAPIGGFVPLRMRIRNAEDTSRKEYNKILDEALNADKKQETV